MAAKLVSMLAVAALCCASSARATDKVGIQPRLSFDAPAEQSIGFTFLGGLYLPSCVGQGCESPLDSAPSVRALILYQPTPHWGIGMAGQLATVRWRATYVPYGPSPALPQTIHSDLTPGFWGVALRYSIVPDWPVTPIVELALGAAFQAQTGSNSNCNPITPSWQLGIGGRAQLMRGLSVFAMANAMHGSRSYDCVIADGPPPTPFAGWGYGLHAGAGFDLGLGASRSASVGR